MLVEVCSAILQRKLPPKLKDPRRFSVPCTIGVLTVGNALCDIGISCSIMSLSIYKKFEIGQVIDTMITLQFVDYLMKHVYGVV